MSKAVDKKELERYLGKLQNIKDANHVNFNDTEADKKARIERAKKDYSYFVQYYFPHYCKSKPAWFHVEGANMVLKNKNISACMMWGRGLAKSITFNVFVPIWLHLFHKQLYNMVVVGVNEGAANTLLSDIQAEFEENPQLKHDFGELKQYGFWADGEFRTTTGAKFQGLGIGQKPRGLRDKSQRPDYIVMDDCDDDLTVKNQKRVHELKKWALSALLPIIGSGIGRFLAVNNLIADISLMGLLSKQPGFVLHRIDACDKDYNPVWDEYTKGWYQMQATKMGWPAFNTEYRNNPTVEGKLFMNEYVQYTPILRLNQYERIVAHWDVAYSDSPSADYNAVVIVGLKGIQRHILYAFCQQCKMESALEFMYNFQKNLPKTVVMEWYGESQFWNTAVELSIQTVTKKLQTDRLPLIFLERPTTNKYSRILQILPAWLRREIYFNKAQEHNKDMQILLDQLKGIEPGYTTHDDGPDAMEGAISKIDKSIVVSEGGMPYLGQNEANGRRY